MTQTTRAGRAPDTPTTSKDDSKKNKADLSDVDVPDMDEIAVGRRFSGNQDILRLERELLADGVELENRAIPMKYHTVKRDYTDSEIAKIIEREVSKEYPNKQLIGYLNELEQ